MYYKRYAIELELTGITRKKAAELVSEVCQKPASYALDVDAYTRLLRKLSMS